MLKKFFWIVVVLVLVYNLALYYVNQQIDFTVSSSDGYKLCHKVWSSRGLYRNHEEQNSLISIRRAFDNGVKGVEVDFYYDVDMDRFILSHDRPKRDSEGKLHYTLKNGKLLTLEELFQKTGKEHYFWLDYKNLDRLSTDETEKAIARLERISKVFHLKERIYIEGSTPWHLTFYTQSGFKTLFAFAPLKESNPFSSLSSNFYKIIYYFFDFTAVAMPYGEIDNPKYNKATQRNLEGIPTFLFHVPDNTKLVHRLVQEDAVRVMLVGRDTSVNRFAITDCNLIN